MTTYKNNFITQVVLEIDYDNIPIQRFLKFLSTDETDNQYWHTWNQQEVRQDDIQVSDESFSRIVNKWIIWVCDDMNGKKIQVSTNSFLITFEKEKYNNQEIITSEFDFIDKFFSFFDIKYLNRVLLRYVNEFSMPDSEDVKKWKWDKYISSKMLENIEVWKDIGDVRRTLADTVVALDDHYLWIRYGIWNRFRPNPIIDRNFILDILVTSVSAIDLSTTSLGEVFSKYKTSLNSTFEYSITDEMREYLSPIK